MVNFSTSYVIVVALLVTISEARFLNEKSGTFKNVVSDFLTACEAFGENSGTCSTLSGRTIDNILANSPPCGMQDLADDMIDFAKKFANNAAFIDAAKRYRALEKNTAPDITTASANGALDRNSLFCDRVPRNPELNGINQAQSPQAAPGVFFDPCTKQSVFAPAPGTSPVSIIVSSSVQATNPAVETSAFPVVTAISSVPTQISDNSVQTTTAVETTTTNVQPATEATSEPCNTSNVAAATEMGDNYDSENEEDDMMVKNENASGEDDEDDEDEDEDNEDDEASDAENEDEDDEEFGNDEDDDDEDKENDESDEDQENNEDDEDEGDNDEDDGEENEDDMDVDDENDKSGDEEEKDDKDDNEVDDDEEGCDENTTS